MKKTYARNFVYGASDGVITTYAIVAGVFGAELPHQTAIILGLANLIADGFSMAASNYISLVSFNSSSKSKSDALAQSLVTFIAFVSFGLLPLTPILIRLFIPDFKGLFFATAMLAMCAFFLLGILKARWEKQSFLISIFITTLIGMSAAFLAYWAGNLISKLT